MTEVLIKRLSRNIKLPKYETDGSSGMDLSANIQGKVKIKPGKSSIIPTGISLSIPKNFEIQIRPRSGLAAKNHVTVLNTPGTVDAALQSPPAPPLPSSQASAGPPRTRK